MYLLPFSQITKSDVEIAGGKGASLGEMTNAGINIPPGYVVIAQAFDRFIKETNIKQEIIARLKEVKGDDINSVDKAGNIIRGIIESTPMPEDIGAEIESAFAELNSEFVAVRSSATSEDSADASWAGELDTYLNTTKETLVENVKKCWASLFTTRAIFYRHEKGLIDAHVSVAVVIQKMIQSEISGVSFTVHPVTEDYDQMIIEAGFGLGEAIVSGQVTPDSYIIKKSDMSLLDIHIGAQNKMLSKAEPGAENHNKWTDLTDAEKTKQKLPGRKIIELAKVCLQIEEHYDFPCDIEWAIENDEIFITQSRPITTLKKNPIN